MQDLSSFLGQVLPWLPSFAIVVLTNCAIAAWGRPLGRARYAIAFVLACTPTLVPEHAAYRAPWGVLTTVLTTFVIVTAARLPDWDGFVRCPRGRLESYFWLAFPMARRRATSSLSERREQALSFAAKGGAKWLAWQVLKWGALQFPTAELPWPAQSALLMLFFVLNLTATSDFLSAFCLLCGYEVDLLFDAPLLAKSPRDFWSRRWNRFISRFALKHVALKMRKGRSGVAIIFSVFAVSGIFHEYFAWSVGGSQAGHGYMTLFFLVQGLIVWMGTRLPLRIDSPVLNNALTWTWMILTAPLFFRAVEVALLAFEYPANWLPF